MRRDRLAPLAVLTGLALAGLSAALVWPDGSASSDDAQNTSTTPAPHHEQGVAPTNFAQHFEPGHRPTPATGSGQQTPDVASGIPRQLELPRLSVSAEITPIGTDGSRTLVPPEDFTKVGWWAIGAKPGAGQGTTIIAGHTVHTGGGALDDLEQMQVGDRVIVDRTRQDVEYVVSSVKTYRKGRLAAQSAQVFNQGGPERLAIVTCEDWNGSVYLSNVVVIATQPQPIGRG